MVTLFSLQSVQQLDRQGLLSEPLITIWVLWLGHFVLQNPVFVFSLRDKNSIK